MIPTSLAENEFDVLVIGGGITGACAAWDAALRGLSVALVEKCDFGSATSANSLRVLHGGIRYLQHLDIRRLRESCRERSAFLRIAPHLTRVMPFYVPTYGHSLQGKAIFWIALQILSVLTWDRNRGIKDPAQRIPAGFILKKAEAVNDMPHVSMDNLTGAGVFCDGQIINAPRLVWSIVRSAIDAGAVVCNYCNVTQITADDGRVTGAIVSDSETGDECEIQAQAVINATGPFAQSLIEQTECAKPLDIPLSRDMALVVKRKILGNSALGMQTKYRDPDAIITRGNRHLFMCPWRDYTLIGVHSRVYDEDPYQLRVTEEEIEVFIDEINDAAPSLHLKRSEIDVVYGGLLPFGENTGESADLSFGKRSHIIDHSEYEGPQGLISAMTVRWTMGRATAKDAVDLAENYLRERITKCRTEHTAVYGGDIDSLDSVRESISRDNVAGRLSKPIQEHLAGSYGSSWREVLNLAKDNPELLEQIGRFQAIKAEIVYAVQTEMARTLADSVLRRTDIGTGEVPDINALRICAQLMARELGWDTARIASEIRKVQLDYPFVSSAKPPSELAGAA